MRRSLTAPMPVITLWCALAAGSMHAGAASLPENMHYSADGTRLITGGVESTGLYDESLLKTIALTFSQSDYWTQLTNNYSSETDIAATLVLDTVTYANVGVRFKGMTSYSQTGTSKKKSFNITADFVDSTQSIQGYKTLNLNNCFSDASFMREVLYFSIFRNYAPCPKANFAALTVNGESYGIYANVQQLNSDFVKEWFLSNSGDRWKAPMVAGAHKITAGDDSSAEKTAIQIFSGGTRALSWLGSSLSSYEAAYQLKSSNTADPWQDLIATCNILNNAATNYADTLETILDVDRWLWFLALENIFTDEDSYLTKGADYQFYNEGETERIHPLEYDGNESMKTADTSLSPFEGASNSERPVIKKLLAVPAIRQRYLAHIRTILSESFNWTVIEPRITAYTSLISAGVLADTKKLTTNTAFNSSAAELKTFVTNRRTSLLANSEVKLTAPTIASVTKSAGSSGNAAHVTATITGTSAGTVLLYYGGGYTGRFRSVTMYDDGAHGDGTSGDGVFGGDIPAMTVGEPVRYYVEARANTSTATTSFSPAGAEHDVYVFTATAALADSTPVVINEVMPSNTETIADSLGEYEDWIELRNITSAATDLSGMYLSDDITDQRKWVFPSGTSLAAGGHLLVWAGEDSLDTTALHTGFKLSASGETVILSDTDAHANAILDSVTFGPLAEDTALGRYPDGSGTFRILAAATPEASNAGIAVTADTTSAATAVVINEVMAANTETTVDPQGEYEDWIELRNITSAAVDLAGMYLSDSTVNPLRWTFPSGTTIPAGGYILVWADGDTLDTGLHANFKLSADGSPVILSDTDANGNALLDFVTTGELGDDASWGRYPDGSGPSAALAAPTPGTANIRAAVTADTASATAPVVINEIMSLNTAALANYAGAYEDWVEIRNLTTAAVDLAGMYLSDNPADSRKWAFPSGATIPAGGYLLVWMDADTLDTTALHANFKLSSSGGILTLSDTDTNGNAVLTVVTVGALRANTVWGRYPDGSGNFALLSSPTPGTTNAAVAETTPVATRLVINEIMSSNTAALADPQGEYDDWIEIRNITASAIDLAGMYLSDDTTDPRKWDFPSGTTIAAGGYLVVWADDDGGDSTGVHAAFKLSAMGETLILSDTDINTNTVLDSVSFGTLAADEVWGRYPDGSGSFALLSSPTPGEANSAATEISTATTVVINEIMSSNTAATADPQGDYEDWIELKNTGTLLVDLSGACLSDDAANPRKWSFPSGTTIAAGGYLVVWADGDTLDSGVHANFKLSSAGETVLLSDTAANGAALLDSVTFGILAADAVWGRYPDGSGSFALLSSPTPGASNSATDTVSEDTPVTFRLEQNHPNPFNGATIIGFSLPGATPVELCVYNLCGQKVATIVRDTYAAGRYEFQWNGRDDAGKELASGVYLYRLRAGTMQKVMRLTLLK